MKIMNKQSAAVNAVYHLFSNSHICGRILQAWLDSTNVLKLAVGLLMNILWRNNLR